jgi:cyclopropane fatty-acyl-phospholipid synthase-like methyltransferase
VTDERERLAGLRNLALYISEPGSIWKVQGLADPKNDYGKMIEDPERARVYTRLLYNFYRGSKNAFADSLDLTGVEQVMDIGGGSGIVSIYLAQKYPDLKGVIVDFKNVCVEGRKIVEENHLSGRITFHGANFVADELPQGFDMVLHYDIGVFGEELFCKLWESLKPGGRIAVVFRFPPSENVAPEPYLKWAFLDSLKDPDFGFPTISQIQAQLVRAGFQLLPDVHTLPDGYVVQARKTKEE